MELTRTKHWGRIWSCVQSLMSPGILLGSGLTSYAGKPGFYACATAVFIGAGVLGFQMIDITKCSSPQLSSSADNDSPIPPAPPPISLAKYGHQATPLLSGVGGVGSETAGLYPLRRSISLQQPVYPCCREAGEFGATATSGMGMVGPGLGYGLGAYPPGYSPYCRECVLSASPIPPAWGMPAYYPHQPTPPPGAMIRSYSLPQTVPIQIGGSHHSLKSTGTQTNPNSPVRTCSRGTNGQVSSYPGSYDRLPTLPGSFLPPDSVIRDADRGGGGGGGLGREPKSKYPHPSLRPTTGAGPGPPSFKQTVMFASNPQLFPASATQSSATSTTDRSGTPTYSNNHNNHIHNHVHNHGHAHPHPHPHTHTQRHNGNGGGNGQPKPKQPQEAEQDRDSSPNGRAESPRHYYPQKEERRANFIRTHKGQGQGQHQGQGVPDPGQGSSQPPQPQRFYPQPKPPTMVTTVETHKKPGDAPKTPILGEKQPPAFTRHYFDSSKIVKGSAAGISSNIFSNGGAAVPTTPAPRGSTNINKSVHLNAAPPNLNASGGGGGGAPATTSSSGPTGSRRGQFFIPPPPILNAQQQQLHHQQQVRQSQNQNQPTLPISVSAVNAKLQQYQRQQQQQQEQVNWRNIQKQSASQQSSSNVENDFENDPDPPYYPAAATPTTQAQQKKQGQGQGQAQSHPHSHAHSSHQTRSTKVSGPEFDVEPPKFNSLRKSLNRSGQNSSVSSQLNYSITPTPVHQHHPHGQGHGQLHGQLHGHGHGHPIPQPLLPYHLQQQFSLGGNYQLPNYPYFPPPHYHPRQDVIIDRRRQGNLNDNINLGGGGSGGGGSGRESRSSNPPRDDCPYCDPRGPPPPLSLSVPTLQQSDPHYMCHYGYGGGGQGQGQGGGQGHPIPMLRRRNTWHHHRDQLEAITTSV